MNEFCGACKAEAEAHDAVCDVCYVPLCGNLDCSFEVPEAMEKAWNLELLLVCAECLGKYKRGEPSPREAQFLPRGD